MDTKVCIICRKQKPLEEFNEEHIFPATIGGHLRIKSVCIECNEKLGKRFDTPFINEHRISTCKHILQIRRKGRQRGITHPLNKAKLSTDDQKKFYLKREANQLKLIRKPDHKLTHVKDSIQVKINGSPDSLDKLAADIIAKYGFNRGQMKNVSKQIKSVSRPVTIPVDDKPIKYEALKVAYEFTASVLPDYLTDPMSKKYSEFLESGGGEDFVLEQIEKVESHKDIWWEDYKKLSSYPTYMHGLFLKSYAGLGLVCIVKFFNYFVFHLVTDECLLDGPPILLLNDPLINQPVILIES